MIIMQNLDIFLYKLLWNSLRRIHPRRPKTWIYNKYWIFKEGFSHFFIYDVVRFKLVFLNLHSLFDISFYNLGAYFNTLDYYNKKAESGEMPLEEAKKKATEVISSQRYDEDNY